eukprot:CAMPEP_0197528016 /NCGR_PEP_ID=MMETSP1318-20131121/23561_1 /TAXON_ID=552666 /ORGANISM="Partenskyella glossopodia, Strain RCC365" /LENGTH=218 /DNA_ID=CAMNT_0043082915 /DNA_START=776 /DNA_END=1429 /DNA_ORIENTATION=-
MGLFLVPAVVGSNSKLEPASRAGRHQVFGYRTDLSVDGLGLDSLFILRLRPRRVFDLSFSAKGNGRDDTSGRLVDPDQEAFLSDVSLAAAGVCAGVVPFGVWKDASLHVHAVSSENCEMSLSSSGSKTFFSSFFVFRRSGSPGLSGKHAGSIARANVAPILVFFSSPPRRAEDPRWRVKVCKSRKGRYRCLQPLTRVAGEKGLTTRRKDARGRGDVDL